MLYSISYIQYGNIPIRDSPPLVQLFIIFNDFYCFWTKMLQLFAPAGIPRAKIHEKVICYVKYKTFWRRRPHQKKILTLY